MSIKFIDFFDQVHKEVLKVSWASKKEVVGSTIMVMVIVFFASLFFLSIDMVVYNLVQYLLRIGR